MGLELLNIFIGKGDFKDGFESRGLSEQMEGGE